MNFEYEYIQENTTENVGHIVWCQVHEAILYWLSHGTKETFYKY